MILDILFTSGTTWRPWSGEVSPLPPLHQEEARDIEAGDPRLVHGALDTGAGANWVRYLRSCTGGEEANIAATCGSLGELILTIICRWQVRTWKMFIKNVFKTICFWNLSHRDCKKVS